MDFIQLNKEENLVLHRVPVSVRMTIAALAASLLSLPSMPWGETVLAASPTLVNGNSVYSNGNLFTYTLPTGASISTGAETALSRSTWQVSASSYDTTSDAPANAIDGNLQSRWSTGLQQNSGEWYEINLGSTQTFNQIVLDSGPRSPGDYIRHYQVFVSNDGVHWRGAVAYGTGTNETVTITMPTQKAQYIRLVSTGSSGNWWSIAELNVYKEAKGSGIWQAPTTVSSALKLQSGTLANGAAVTTVTNDSTNATTFPMSTDDSITYTLPAGATTTFTETNPAQFTQASLGKVVPGYGLSDQTVTIRGSGLGPSQGLGTVMFGTTPADIMSWSDSSITALVPYGLPLGATDVTVYGSEGQYAGSAPFSIVQPVPLPRTGWTASASNLDTFGDLPSHMLDGALDTRYSTGTGQTPGMWVEVNMNHPQTFDEIDLDSGPSTYDFARNAAVYVSNDGNHWTKVDSIIGNGTVEIATFPTQKAQYIKVVNTGSSGNWWSIAEFNVFDFLAPPTQLQATGTTATGTTLTWNPVKNATSYNVFMNGGSQPVATVERPRYSVSSLIPGGTYTFTVVAKDNSTQSGLSQPVAVNTLPAGQLPEVPFAGGLPVMGLAGAGVFLLARKRKNDKRVRVVGK